ncbi:MAG: hypothetical protein WD649_00010 [Thermoleophilaceae bacterium]
MATAGAELDQAVEHLDSETLTARLATFEEQAAVEPTPDLAEAIHAVRRELEHRRDLLNRAGQARVRLHRSVARLDRLAQRLDDGHGPAEPQRAAAGLDRSLGELGAFRPTLDDVRES